MRGAKRGEVVGEAADVFPALAVDVPSGAGTPGEPVGAFPVVDVVLAFLSRLGVVGDFVAVESGGGHAGVNMIEHREFEFFVDGGEFALVEAGGHGGVGFVGEGVAGHVLWLEGKGLGEGVFPGGEGLAGYAEDEVEVEVVEAGVAGDLEGFGHVFGVVVALEGFEFGGVEGLSAEADAVDAVVTEDFGAGGLESVRIRFDGEFGEMVVSDGGIDEGEKALEAWWVEEGGGAATDEDSLRGKWA